MKGINLLIIEDDTDLLNVLERRFKKKGFNVNSFTSPVEAVQWFKNNKTDIVLLDLGLPQISGEKTMEILYKIDNELIIIIITGLNDIKTAVKIMKKGAFDYLLKPFDLNEMDKTINKAVVTIRAKDSMEFNKYNHCPEIIFESKKMSNILKLSEKIAATSFSSVLITGESGVGKDVVARYIHCRSSRRDNPFVKINCASIPRDLVESELFGYEKGAFTGAEKQKKGLFELARGGTLFLDEIGELPLETQPKLLRALEEKKVRRIGGERDIFIDINIISATNRDPEKMVKEGKFRKDLFYRINVFTINIPPLRERKEDIISLTKFLLNKKQKELKLKTVKISDEVYNLFLQYSWPGNIRELQNVIERALILGSGEEEIKVSHIPPEISGIKSNCKKNSLNAVEAEYIREKLEHNNWNISQTARQLGISRNTLKNKIKRYNLK